MDRAIENNKRNIFKITQEIIYWHPELSKLAQCTNSSLQNSLELHFLIELNDFEGSPRTFLEGCPMDHHHSSVLSTKLQTSIKTYSFLKSRCHCITSSYIPTTEMTLTATDNEHSVKCIAIRQILLSCSNHPLRINGTIVYTSQIGMWLAKCAEFINRNCPKFECRSASYRKAVSTYDSFENDENVNRDFGMRNISDQNKGGSSTNEPLLLQICNDYCEAFRNRLSELDGTFFEIKELRIILSEILSKLSENDRRRSNAKEQTEIWTSVLSTMLRNYNNSFAKCLQEKICVTEEEFKKLHEKILTSSKKVVRWEDFPRQKLNELFEKITENQRSYFLKTNNFIFEEEKRISEEAYDFAVTNFKSLIEHKLSYSTFSENEFQVAYQRMSIATLELFMKVLETPHTAPWKLRYKLLQETLTSLQTHYKRQNGNQFMEIDLARKEAIEVGTQCYQNEMRKTIAGSRLSDEKLSSVRSSCCDIAMQRFHQKIGKNISKNVSMSWENDLRTVMNDVDSMFRKENPNFAQSSQNDRCGVALYIDPQRVGIYVEQEVQSTDHFLEYDHNIAIVRGNILFSEEASSYVDKEQTEGVWYGTVFRLANDLNDSFWSVNVNGRLVKIGQVELLSLYFHQIKLKSELKINRKIYSCFVVATGLLNSAAKQILKSSLTLAGFDGNTLISPTTAMAISYSRIADLSKRKTHSNLFIYTSANLVEVAVADVSSDRVTVKNLCGAKMKGSDKDLEQNLMNILLDHVPLRQYSRIIFCFATKMPTQRSDLICDMILKLLPKAFSNSGAISFDLTSEIIRVAALLHSVQNGQSVFPTIPTYNSVHPYKLTMEIKGQHISLSDFNNQDPKEWPIDRYGDVQVIVFTEEAKASKDRWTVGKYHLVYSHEERNFRTKIIILLKEEGNLSIQLSEEDYLVKSNVKSITSFGWLDLCAVMKPIIAEMEFRFDRQYRVLKLRRNSQSSVASNTTDCVSEKVVDELKITLPVLIEKIRDELRISKMTTTAHRDNIESKISKCVELLKSSAIKVKQLEIEKNNLERAAKFIK